MIKMEMGFCTRRNLDVARAIYLRYCLVQISKCFAVFFNYKKKVEVETNCLKGKNHDIDTS